MLSGTSFRLRSFSLLDLIVVACFVAGVAWRIVFVVYEHDPRNFLYSDMQGYVTQAKKLIETPDALGPYDLLMPPGTSAVIAFFYRLDPSLKLAVFGNLFFSVAIPLLTGLAGTLWFGRTSGKVALALSSLYFPFIDYAGYFLSELYNIFFFALFLTCFAAAGYVSKVSVSRALAAGFVLSVLFWFKAYWFPAIGLLLLSYAFFYTTSPAKVRVATLALILAGFLPFFTYMSVRCTHLNEGRFCPGSQNGSWNFVMGHYGRGGFFIWKDDARGMVTAFGSPGAAQRGLTTETEFKHSVMDAGANMQAAWWWIGQNPLPALVQSLEHVNDAFFSTYPWPSINTDKWAFTMLYHYIFLVFLFFPAIFAIYEAARGRHWYDFLASREFLAVTPVLGLIAALILATGEARYRVPFDPAIVLLAAHFYCRRRVSV